MDDVWLLAERWFPGLLPGSMRCLTLYEENHGQTNHSPAFIRRVNSYVLVNGPRVCLFTATCKHLNHLTYLDDHSTQSPIEQKCLAPIVESRVSGHVTLTSRLEKSVALWRLYIRNVVPSLTGFSHLVLTFVSLFRFHNTSHLFSASFSSSR